MVLTAADRYQFAVSGRYQPTGQRRRDGHQTIPDPALHTMWAASIIHDTMTPLTKLFEKSCNVFATTKKTNSLLCRSATKRRPRRLQVACAVDRRTAAELQDQSPTDPPTHRYTCQHPAIIHTDRHAVTVTAGEPLDQSQTDPPTHRYTRQHQAIIHTDTQTDRQTGVAVTDIHSDSHSW